MSARLVLSSAFISKIGPTPYPLWDITPPWMLLITVHFKLYNIFVCVLFCVWMSTIRWKHLSKCMVGRYVDVKECNINTHRPPYGDPQTPKLNYDVAGVPLGPSVKWHIEYTEIVARCVIHIQTCSPGLVRSLHFAVIKNKTMALREWTLACENARTALRE